MLTIILKPISAISDYQSKLLLQENRILFVILFLISGCASLERNRLYERPLQDVFDHTLLEAFGVNVVKKPKIEFDPKLLALISEFLLRARENGVIISRDSINSLRKATFNTAKHKGSDSGVLGKCHRVTSVAPKIDGKTTIRWTEVEIMINRIRSFFSKGTCTELEAIRLVLTHELGHCLLDLGHLVDGETLAIMNETFINTTALCQNFPQLLRDMFSREQLEMLKKPRVN